MRNATVKRFMAADFVFQNEIWKHSTDKLRGSIRLAALNTPTTHVPQDPVAAE